MTDTRGRRLRYLTIVKKPLHRVMESLRHVLPVEAGHDLPLFSLSPSLINCIAHSKFDSCPMNY